MEERRHSKRLDIFTNAVIKSVDGTEKEVQIDVINVSKTGIGFTCKQELIMENIYESFLTIWTKEVLHAILKVVRVEEKEDYIEYGALFVGMSEQEIFRIQVYQTVQEGTAVDVD